MTNQVVGASGGGSRVESWLGDHTIEVLPNRTSIASLPSIPPETPHSITNLQSETIEQTVDFALRLLGDRRVVVPHVSASRIGRQKAHEVGSVLQERSVGDVFIMSGDNDGNIVSYATTLDLLEDWHQAGIMFERIGVVGHPEGHTNVADHILDQALKDKQAFAENAGVEMYVVTQMCFDPSATASWVQHVRETGIYLPIFVGLPGPVDQSELIRYCGICGVGDSAKYLQLDPDLSSEQTTGNLQEFDPYSFLSKLADVTDELVKIQGTYFFTFNQPAKTAEWLSSVREVA